MLKCERQNWATDKQVTVVSNIGRNPQLPPSPGMCWMLLRNTWKKKSLEPDMVMLIGSLHATVKAKQLT